MLACKAGFLSFSQTRNCSGYRVAEDVEEILPPALYFLSVCRVRMDAAMALSGMADLRTNNLMGLQALLQVFRERLIDSTTSEVIE